MSPSPLVFDVSESPNSPEHRWRAGNAPGALTLEHGRLGMQQLEARAFRSKLARWWQHNNLYLQVIVNLLSSHLLVLLNRVSSDRPVFLVAAQCLIALAILTFVRRTVSHLSAPGAQRRVFPSISLLKLKLWYPMTLCWVFQVSTGFLVLHETSVAAFTALRTLSVVLAAAAGSWQDLMHAPSPKMMASISGINLGCLLHALSRYPYTSVLGAVLILLNLLATVCPLLYFNYMKRGMMDAQATPPTQSPFLLMHASKRGTSPRDPDAEPNPMPVPGLSLHTFLLHASVWDITFFQLLLAVPSLIVGGWVVQQPSVAVSQGTGWRDLALVTGLSRVPFPVLVVSGCALGFTQLTWFGFVRNNSVITTDAAVLHVSSKVMSIVATMVVGGATLPSLLGDGTALLAACVYAFLRRSSSPRRRHLRRKQGNQTPQSPMTPPVTPPTPSFLRVEMSVSGAAPLEQPSDAHQAHDLDSEAMRQADPSAAQSAMSSHRGIHVGSLRSFWPVATWAGLTFAIAVLLTVLIIQPG